MKLSGLIVVVAATAGIAPAITEAQVSEVPSMVLENLPDLEPGLLDFVSEGFETWLYEFVEDGDRPNDESLDWFLSTSGFSSELAASGWRWFDVPYGANKTSIQVQMDETGRMFSVRLDLTKIDGGRATQVLTTTMLESAAKGGPATFETVDGILGLYLRLDGESVNDIVLRRAINALLVQAEQTAPIWNAAKQAGG